jgi:hypothetical protein
MSNPFATVNLFHIRKRSSIKIFAILLFLIAIVGYYRTKAPISIIDRDDFFIGMYSSSNSSSSDLLKLHIVQGVNDSINNSTNAQYKSDPSVKAQANAPLYVAPLILKQLLVSKSNRDEVMRAVALAELDSMMIEFNKFGYWPRPAHPPLEAGWWSGMDFASAAITLQAAYEITGDSRWATDRDKVASKIFESTDRFGSRLLLNKENEASTTCWYLEYVWQGVNVDNAFFVQNGALYTLLALKLLADATGNSEYQEHFECGVKGFEELAENYYYPDKTWSYYQLRPKTIIEPHYVTIEMTLLQSLYHISDKEIFKDALEARRKFLKLNFPVFASKSSDQKSIDYVFTRFGSPHPYYIDLNKNDIFFFDEASKVVGYNQSKIRGTINSGDACIKGNLPANAFRYSIFTEPANKLVLHEGKLEALDRDRFERLPTQVEYEISASGDGSLLANGEVMVKPFFDADKENPGSYLNNRASISIKFRSPIDRNKSPLIGIMFSTDQLTQINFVAFDTNGKAATRHFNVSNKSNNNIVISLTGFNEIQTLGDHISSIQIDLLTDPLKAKGVKKFKFDIDSISSESDMLPYCNLQNNKNLKVNFVDSYEIF